MRSVPQMLAEIPELAIEIQATLGVGAPNPTARPEIRRPMPGSKPPLDLDVIDLLRVDPLNGLIIGSGSAQSHLLDRLGMCARMIEEERADAGFTQPTLVTYKHWSTVCAYLASTSSWWLTERGVAEDVSYEVTQIWKALRSAARAPEDEIPLKCPVIGCGDRTDLQPGGQWVLCRNGHKRDIHAEKMHFLGMQEWTLAQCRRKLAEHFGQKVSIKTLESWTKRVDSDGRVKLQSVRRTQRGTAIYSFAAVMVLAKVRRHAEPLEVAS